jgi:hypothetical protein
MLIAACNSQDCLLLARDHESALETGFGFGCIPLSPGFFILNASAMDSRPCGNGSIAYSSIALSGTTKSRGRAVFIEKISSIS